MPRKRSLTGRKEKIIGRAATLRTRQTDSDAGASPLHSIASADGPEDMEANPIVELSNVPSTSHFVAPRAKKSKTVDNVVGTPVSTQASIRQGSVVNVVGTPVSTQASSNRVSVRQGSVVNVVGTPVSTQAWSNRVSVRLGSVVANRGDVNTRQSARRHKLSVQNIGQIEERMKKVLSDYIGRPWPKNRAPTRRLSAGANNTCCGDECDCASYAQCQQNAVAFTAADNYVKEFKHGVDASPKFKKTSANAGVRPTARCHQKSDFQCAARSSGHRVDFYDCGQFGDFMCLHCGARLLRGEQDKIKGGRLTPCCANGVVHTEPMLAEFNELQQPPKVFIEGLINTNDDRVREAFLNNTMAFNNSFAFASTHGEKAPAEQMGGRMDTCKYNGEFSFQFSDLIAPGGRPPAFAQVYTLSPEAAMGIREQNLESVLPQHVKKEIMGMLEETMRQNPFGKSFETVGTKLEEAKTSTGEVPHFKIVLLTDRNLKCDALKNRGDVTVIERADAPTAKQVAVIWVQDDGLPLLDSFYGGDANQRRKSPQLIAVEQVALLNADQMAAFDQISHALLGGGRQKLFFLEGAGGCGKTFFYNTLIKWCIAGKPLLSASVDDAWGRDKSTLRRSAVVAAASTGIAALLLIGGGTAHRHFYVPNDVTDETAPMLNFESVKAQQLREADLIIIDEISMLSNKVLRYIDRLLRDVCAGADPFGGKVIVLSGDWRQLAPVVEHGTREDQVAESIKIDKLFKGFQKMSLTINMRTGADEILLRDLLAKIGQGISDVGTNQLLIPPQLLALTLEDAIQFCFPEALFSDPLANADAIANNAVLCPTNNDVQYINELALARMSGDAKDFPSIDEPMEPNEEFHTFRTDFNIEAVHNETPSGMPPHKLFLKVGTPVMLIRNLDVTQGLCNGTRLQVMRMAEDSLFCRILTGPRADTNSVVVLPRIQFEYGRGRHHRGLRFRRLQFPIRTCFAMTINKAQGQTLQRMALVLNGKQCFSHGQVYVAMSRVTHMDGIRVFAPYCQSGDDNSTFITNVVYHELLDEYVGSHIGSSNNPVGTGQQPSLVQADTTPVRHLSAEFNDFRVGTSTNTPANNDVECSDDDYFN